MTPSTLQIADVVLGMLQITILRYPEPAVTTEDPETGEPVVVEPAKPLRLRFTRYYRVADDAGDPIPSIPARKIHVDADFDKLPGAIANGLAAIDDYTRRQARIHARLLSEEA